MDQQTICSNIFFLFVSSKNDYHMFIAALPFHTICEGLQVTIDPLKVGLRCLLHMATISLLRGEGRPAEVFDKSVLNLLT